MSRSNQALSRQAAGQKGESQRRTSFFQRPLNAPLLAAICLTWLAVSISGELAWGRATAPSLVAGHWLTGFAWFAAGLIIWLRRPGVCFGPLLTLTSFVWLNEGFLGSGNAWMSLHSLLSRTVFAALVIWLIFAYPTAQIERRVERWAVFITISYLVLLGLIQSVAWPDVWQWRVCNLCLSEVVTDNPIAMGTDRSLTVWLESMDGWITPILAFVLLSLMALRYRQATRAGRDALRPVWFGAAFAAFYLAVRHLFPLSTSGEVELDQVLAIETSRSIQIGISWLEAAAFSLIPLAFLFGFLQVRAMQGPVGRLIDDLGQGGEETDTLETAIAKALGDPTARIFYRVGSSESFTDTRGRPVDLVSERVDRAVSDLEHHGENLGVLVHDRLLLGQPELVHSISAAAGMALANQRLQAQVLAQLAEVETSRQAQLAEVEASRARILQAANAERRRIERNLHDGAQQRLVALRLSMLLSAARMGPENNEIAAELRTRADEIGEAIGELRELARGIHPSVLTDEGLSAAIEVLIQRANIPVDLEDRLPARPPPEIEAVAYYVVAEGLSNVAKYANAKRVSVSLFWQPDEMIVVIEDDGVGGANPANGTGLTGLRDRVAAVRGTLEVRSTPGTGTSLRARFPVRGMPES